MGVDAMQETKLKGEATDISFIPNGVIPMKNISWTHRYTTLPIVRVYLPPDIGDGFITNRYNFDDILGTVLERTLRKILTQKGINCKISDYGLSLSPKGDFLVNNIRLQDLT